MGVSGLVETGYETSSFVVLENRDDGWVRFRFGKPVEGPPRWTLMMIIGSSVITARPIASPLSAIPGPLEAVTAISPAKAAPIEAVMAAISSSA